MGCGTSVHTRATSVDTVRLDPTAGLGGAAVGGLC